MAVIEAAGVPVGAPSTLTLPLTGRPWADLTLAQDRVPWKAGDVVDVAVQDGPQYRMTVERVGPRGGFTRARLVAGTGGLSRDVGAKWYREIPAATVVRELLEECGEVAGEINLPGTLPAWVRAAGPAHEALRAVMMRYPERFWQMTPDGRVDVGVPLWPEAQAPVQVEAEDAAAGVYTAGFTPGLLPGQKVTLTRGEEELAKRVTRITHSIQEAYAYPRNQVQLRTLVGTGDGQDLGVSGLEASVQRAVRWVDYLALFDCEVLRDWGDHTLDLRPYHPLLPELTRVRLVQPIPGARVKLRAGGVVLLSFQRGDPARPVVLHYGVCELEACEIVTGRGQRIRLDDDRGDVSPEDARYRQPHVRLQDAAGQSVELWAENGRERVTVRDRAGQIVELDPAAGQIHITGNALVKISAPLVEVNGGQVVLAGGGPPVGRVGDAVQVTGVMPGPGTAMGTIVAGSPKVTAG